MGKDKGQSRTCAFGLFSLALSLVLITLSLPSSAVAYSLYDPPQIVPRVDYSLGLVFLERWRGDYFIGVEQVLPISEYLDYQLAQSVRDAWQEQADKDREREELAADASGLIPDIQLPKLPIFGEGSKIDISGKDRITLGGRQTFVRGVYQTPGSSGLFPELKMEQQLSVILNGTIGERTKVNIDHDSEREEAKNKVMLSYTGTEDDVIQAVELGDTRLTIPSTGYTGDLPAHHGLFGATAKGRVGGVDVYAIASREQSQSQTQSFTGRRRVSVDTIYEYQYMTRRFYRVDVTGTISNLRVYIDDRNPGNNQSAYKAIATVFPDAPGDTTPYWSYDRAPGDFDLKSLGKDYFLHPGNILEFATQLNAQDVVGLVIFTNNDTIGGQTWQDSLVLKLLKPEMPDSLSHTWDYEQRNVYSLPQGDVSISSLRLFRDQPDQAQDVEVETDGTNRGRKFVELLGLDPNGDGRIEYPEFESKTGLIRFPGAKPFDSSALSVRERIIYRRDPGSLRNGEGLKYYMVAEYSSAAESYYLGQPDITEYTEKVIVNGSQWSREAGDYTIDYKTGVLAFVRALPPDADIQVTYEYRPLFSLSQKSLVGGRAEWAASQEGKLGASVFFRDEGIQDEKPALGSEPYRRTIAETDASYTVSSDAISAFLDGLPLLRAQSATTFSAAAEGAVSLPDPNTRGVAYLDDFEGTTITRDVSITALLWSPASVPVDKDTAHFAQTRLFWINPLTKVRNDSVFGPSVGDEGTETHEVLRVTFTPDAGDRGSWAGMMTSAAQSGMSMNLKDVDNLRMILKTRRSTGTIHVTVGMSIDEDAPRRNRAGAIVGLDGRNNTEDLNANGVLDAGEEDRGLDTVFGIDSTWGGADTVDDGNDDYNSSTNPTGTEGNNHLDGEDLDRSGFSRYNHYFECDIPLGDERYFTDLVNGWKLCRVSLHDSVSFRTVGQPKWEDIRLVRVWMDGYDAPDTIDFYSVEFIGSRWTNPLLLSIRDTTRPPGHVPGDTTEKVWATQISRKTDTSYTAPFQLKRDASGNLEEEGALLFGYQNLRGYRRATVNKTAADQEDYREYRDLRMYVHDDGNGLAFLLRLGSDSVNYYEYRAPVTAGELVPGRDGKWYEFVIPLDSFPMLKMRRDQADVPKNIVWSSGPYRVFGTPSLADIRYTALGIEHPGSARINGGLWFDDMRLTGPHKEPGYGFQAHSNLALSDFVTLGVNYGYSDPNFRRFSEGRGVKAGGFGTSLGASAHANLDRLLPFSWGLSIPLTYSISDQRDVPKFSPLYPDLLLPAEQASSPDYVTSGHSEEISVDNVRKQRSGNPWLNYTLEGMGISWRQRRGLSRSSLNRDSSWASTFQWGYAVSPDLKVKVGSDDELSLFPQDIRFGITDGRQQTLRGTRISLDSAFRTDTLTGHGLATDFGVEYSPIEDMTFDYGVQTERDLIIADSLSDSLWFLNIGAEASRDHSFDAGYNLDIADAITPGVDFSGNYSHERIKSGLSYDSVLNMNNSGDIEFTLNTDLPELLGRLEVRSPRPKGPGPEGEPPGRRSGKVRPEPKGDTLGGEPVEPGLEPPPPPPDTLGKQPPLRPDSTPQPGGPSHAFRPLPALASLGSHLEPVEFSYTISRTSDLIGVFDPSPWQYRLGFTDIFPFDSLHDQPNATRERTNTLRVSSGGQVGDLSAKVGYEWSRGLNLSSIFQSTALDRGVTWPDLELTQGKVHNLFKKWATDSKLTASYRRRHDLVGDYVRYYEYGDGDSTRRESLGMYGRTETWSNELNPLLSWTTTWKKRVSTTLSANYTFGTATNFLSDSGTDRSVTHTNDRGMNLSLSYTFTAPQGIKLPFLKKVKFSSDLTFTWTLRVAQTHRWLQKWEAGVPVDPISPLQDDKTYGTALAASYRFSRSIEAGLNAEYSHSQGLSPTTTETMNLDLWVLFRF